MPSVRLIAVLLTCLFSTAAIAAEAAKESATKEIAAAKEAPKAEAKPAADPRGISSHLGDTKVDLRHCLKHSNNREIHRCTL